MWGGAKGKGLPRSQVTVAADLAVHSMLSIQLYTPQRTMGSFNVYGHATDAFGTAAIALAGSFAAQAALAYPCSLDQQDSKPS